VLAMPDVRNALAQQGMQELPGTPAELEKRMRDDAARWTAVVRAANIKAE
jgi:tripartite-type tricarboxylate transporter receptor subunit TctC